MNEQPLFVCSHCQSGLPADPPTWLCNSCGHQIPLRSGIPTFTPNTDYFFGEIAPDHMRELAKAIGRIGWGAAFDEMCAKQSPDMASYIRQYIGDASRANWKYLLQLPQEGTVLDFGCGWGETTLSLARSVRRVISMDLTLERLLLLQARARAVGFDHVNFVHGGDVLPLPFGTNSLDAVVLNGVLEWVPVTSRADPRECQLAILREIQRILKPSGQLYIGIENRVGYKYFLGRVDDHSQLKYTSLMPRWLATRWSQFRKSEAYRTYTYTRRGYAKLLKQAGFSDAQFFCPYPDYREFDRIVPVTSADTRTLYRPTASWKRTCLELPGCKQLLAWTVPTFSIVANKQLPSPSRLQRVIKQIGAQLKIDLTPPATYFSKTIGEIYAFCHRRDEPHPSLLVRVAETSAAQASLQAAAHQLQRLWETSDQASASLACVPRIYGAGRLDGVTYSVEEFKSGVPWCNLANLRKSPNEALPRITEWLAGFHLATVTSACWSTSDLVRKLSALQSEVASLLPRIPTSPAKLNASGTPGNRRPLPDDIPIVISHGDFHIGNILFSPGNQQITGVVDWDLGEMRGLPLVDLITLLIVQGLGVKRQSYGATVAALREFDDLEPAERLAWQRYEIALGLKPAYREYAIRHAVLKNIVALAARRPEAFQRMRGEFACLREWLLHPAIKPACVA